MLDLSFDLSIGDEAAIGPNDRLHAATCMYYGIDAIVSADRGFNEVRGLRRIDPLDAEAIGKLAS